MSKNKWLKLSLLALGAAVSLAPQAKATKINGVRHGQEIYIAGVGYVYAGFGTGAYLGDAPANSLSSTVTEHRIVATAAARTVDLIAGRIAEATGGHGPVLGASSGNALHRKAGVWVSGGYDNIKDTTAGLNWNADVYSGALGMDYKIHPTFLAGLAFVYSNVNGETNFNKGSINDNSYGFAPYLNWKPAKWVSFDVMGAYNWVEKKRDRTTMDTAGNFTGAKITAKPKSKRWFVGGYGNFTHSINRATNLLARLGVTHVEDKQEKVTESNGDAYSDLKTKFTTLHARLQAGYRVTNQLEPYLFASYAYDINRSKMLTPAVAVVNNTTAAYTNPESARSRNTYGGGAGLKMDITRCVSGGVEYKYSQSKKLKIHGVTANLRYVF